MNSNEQGKHKTIHYYHPGKYRELIIHTFSFFPYYEENFFKMSYKIESAMRS